MNRVEIADADDLRRRIPRFHVTSDGSVSSAALIDKRGDLSLDLCRLRSRAESRAELPGCGLFEFPAAVPRDLELQVEHAPLPNNPAHSVIKGVISKRQARKIRDAGSLVVAPDDT